MSDKAVVGQKYSYKDPKNKIIVIEVKGVSESGNLITIINERGYEEVLHKDEWEELGCELLLAHGSKKENRTQESEQASYEGDNDGSKVDEGFGRENKPERRYLIRLLAVLCFVFVLIAVVLSVSLVQSKKKYDGIKNEYTTAIRHNKVQIDSLTLLINNLQNNTDINYKTIDSLLALEPYKRIKEFENKLNRANENIDDLEAKIGKKDNCIKELQARIRELENQNPRIIELEKEVRQKKDSIKDLNIQIETLNGQIASKESSIRELNGQITSKDKRIKEQEKQIIQKEGINKELKTKCDNFESQLSKANSSISLMKSELAKKENTIKGLNETIAKKEKEIEILNNTIKGKK